MAWRWGRVWAMALGIAVATREAAADEAWVPAALQVELLDKLVPYDRNFAARAHANPMVLVAYRDRDAGSEHAARQLAAALAGRRTLGDLPCEAKVVGFTSAEALRAEATKERAGVALLAPGIESSAAEVARVFTGWNGLTVSASGLGVDEGFTVGFVLEQGRPRIRVNVAQSRRQNVDFRSELLRIVRVTP